MSNEYKNVKNLNRRYMQWLDLGRRLSEIYNFNLTMELHVQGIGMLDVELIHYWSADEITVRKSNLI